MMIKNILTTIILLFTINAFAQTTMTVHTPSGATDYLLSDIDSITYNNGGVTPITYLVGDAGPSGGVIIHDKGVFSNGWRYIEASIDDININSAEFGCPYVTNTQAGIGTGQENTNVILAYCSTPGIAAKVCDLYTKVYNGVSYSDWFLPSIDELTIAFSSGMYFAYGSEYWSSTRSTQNDTKAWTLHGSSGNTSEEYEYYSNNIKPMRRF